MESKVEREICGTCMYWKGRREPVEGKPKIAILVECGICQNPVSSKSGESRKNNLKCKEYLQWDLHV